MELMRPMDVDAFAQVVLADVARNEAFIIVPRYWKAIWLLERAAPRLMLKVWERMHRRALKEVEARAEELDVPAASDAPEPAGPTPA